MRYELVKMFSIKIKSFVYNGGAQQFNGREAKTATLLSRRPATRCLRVAGFCPRHLKRWAFSRLMANL